MLKSYNIKILLDTIWDNTVHEFNDKKRKIINLILFNIFSVKHMLWDEQIIKIHIVLKNDSFFQLPYPLFSVKMYANIIHGNKFILGLNQDKGYDTMTD